MALKNEEYKAEQNKLTPKKGLDETAQNAVVLNKEGDEVDGQIKTVSKKKNEESGLSKINVKKKGDETGPNEDETAITIENDISDKEKLSTKNRKNTKAIIIEAEAFCCPCGCCCLQSLMCFNFGFLSTQAGFLKFMKVVIGLFCCGRVQEKKSETGVLSAYDLIIGVLTAIMPTTILLLFCCLFSKKTALLLRQSIFEIVFNAVASIGLVRIFPLEFYEEYLNFSFSSIFSFGELFTGVFFIYVAGFFLTILYIIDASRSFQFYMKTRRI